MKRSPEELSDEALTVALAITRARRAADGCLGVRTELARLESEQDRRTCEALMALPVRAER